MEVRVLPTPPLIGDTACGEQVQVSTLDAEARLKLVDAADNAN